MHDHSFISLMMPVWIGFERKWQLNCFTSKICSSSGFEFNYVVGLYVVEG